MPLIMIPSYSSVDVGSMKLNRNDANVLVEFSAGDLTVTNSSTSTYGSVRANRGFSVGRVYWEVSFTYGSNVGTLAGHYVYFAGVALGGSDIRLIPGYNMPGSYVRTLRGGDYVGTQVYGCYLDVEAGVFEVHRNGELWLGAKLYNMNNEVSGIPVNSKWYPIVAPVGGDIVTCNFGSSSFVYVPKAGYIGAEYVVS
jgi:hypothetical protein